MCASTNASHHYIICSRLFVAAGTNASHHYIICSRLFVAAGTNASRYYIMWSRLFVCRYKRQSSLYNVVPTVRVQVQTPVHLHTRSSSVSHGDRYTGRLLHQRRRPLCRRLGLLQHRRATEGDEVEPEASVVHSEGTQAPANRPQSPLGLFPDSASAEPHRGLIVNT